MRGLWDNRVDVPAAPVVFLFPPNAPLYQGAFVPYRSVFRVSSERSRKRGSSRPGQRLLVSLGALFLASQPMKIAAAPPPADAALGYQMPVPELQAIVDAPRAPQLLVAPDGRAVALVGNAALPPISIVAEPQARLAGIRFNPLLRLDTRFEFGSSLQILEVESRQTHPVTGLPSDLRTVNGLWSPDSRTLALSLIENGAIHLWLVDRTTFTARRASAEPLNAIVTRGFEWFGGGQRLLVVLRPEHEGAAPAGSIVPTGPNVQASDGKKGASQLTTFEDLLKTPFDETLLDYYLSAQVGVLDTNGKLTRIGPIDRLLGIEGAPDGQHILVARLRHPYSRVVPLSQFANDVEVWNDAGQMVESVARMPLIEVIAPGNDAVNPGPRDFSWRADRPATLYWAEAQDGGDPRKPVEIRDIVYTAPIPSGGKHEVLARLARRYRGVYWGRDDLALVGEWTWKSRDRVVWRINPEKPSEAPTLVNAWNFEDRYNDPGVPVLRTNSTGAHVLRMRGDAIFLEGSGATPEGERPFLNRLDLGTRALVTIWRCAAPYYERAIVALNDEGTRLLTQRETVAIPPNLVLHEHPDDPGVALTNFTNPTPQLGGVVKQVLRYKRPDGVELTAKLYLPPGYVAKRDGPLPTLLWAYPQEFKSAATASQVTGSPYRFNAVSFWGPLPFLARGYAVLDDPTMPIVGEGNAEPNDTYVVQLVADAEAAIDEVVRLGVTDRKRVAIGGHSYGAFMTANLLAHTRLFKAGISRSGAYNRTLTPFGFQAEDRNFWVTKEVYLAMSPFVNAEHIKDPLLIIHGEIDNNPGTFPIQSERMYQALNGLGATARLVMLPNESHGYRARESIMHMLWEEDRWLDIYVKQAGADTAH
jgi:dipeptidyl aminopeptidase/acylaminoacyl peptidase